MTTETLILTETETLVVVEAGTELLEGQDTTTVLVETTAGPQGPIGATGPMGAIEDDIMRAKRVDFVGDTIIYTGQAAPGSLTSAAVWRIKRTTFGPGDDVTEEWAGGNEAFDKVWDNRAGLSYS